MQPIDKKLDQIIEKLHSVDVTLAKQHVSLEEHMRRTEVAEKNHEMLRAEFKPIAVHVQHMQGGIRLLGILALVTSIALGLAKFFNK